jgi:hypothetical protein
LSNDKKIVTVGGPATLGCPFAWGLVMAQAQGSLGGPQPMMVQSPCTEARCMAWRPTGEWDNGREVHDCVRLVIEGSALVDTDDSPSPLH